MREINKIILHCSYSDWGDADEIRRWHMEPPNNYDDIGYHYVVLNCYPDCDSWRLKRPDPHRDGEVQEGRPIEIPGAHARGYNHDSIGICWIGKRSFTAPQILYTRKLIDDIRRDFGDIPLFPHSIFNKHGKTCPNIDVDNLNRLYAS